MAAYSRMMKPGYPTWPPDESNSMESRISIIIPVHNGGAAFRRCLRHLQRLVPPPLELIVIANGTTDGSDEAAEAAGARVIRLYSAVGPAQARNVGARAARGEILYFVDADVALPPDALCPIVSTLEAEPDVSALIGSYDDAPGASNFLSQYRNLLHHYVHQHSQAEAFTFWGACGAIRRDIFTAVGGFDESYARPSIEDIELGYRLKQAGHRIRLVPGWQVKHLKRWDFVPMVHTDFFMRALPWAELILRSGALTDDLNLQRSSRLSVIGSYLLLGAGLGAGRWRLLRWVGCLLLAGLIGLNWPLYRFFWQKRGLPFALKVVPLHWMYYLYSGLAFAIALGRHRLRGG